jgi:hypothetical protein
VWQFGIVAVGSLAVGSLALWQWQLGVWQFGSGSWECGIVAVGSVALWQLGVWHCGSWECGSLAVGSLALWQCGWVAVWQVHVLAVCVDFESLPLPCHRIPIAVAINHLMCPFFIYIFVN